MARDNLPPMPRMALTPGKTRVSRFSDEAQAGASILHATCVLPDSAVFDALKTIHKRNPDLSFREFVAGVALARTMREAETWGLQS